MKVLYLFNKVIDNTIDEIKKGIEHDNSLFGMLRIRKYGINTNYNEIEKYIPNKIAKILRKYMLTMHFAHIPLFLSFFKYNIIFTSTAYGCLFLKALFRIKKFKWIILDFNILGTIREKKTIKQKLFSWSIRNGADGIVAISEAEAKALKSEFPNLKDRIIFIHEAIDTIFFKSNNDIIEKNQILTVGNYGRDFDSIIEAVKNINIELIIAGKFDSKMARDLPSYIKVAQYNHKEMLKVYAESKIIIISLNTDNKYFDSIGTLSLGEAMSMGKAVIVTHTKNMESYIDDGINGVFVENKNISDISNAIVDLLTNNDKRLKMGQNAREFAIVNLNPDVFAQKLAFFMKNMV